MVDLVSLTRKCLDVRVAVIGETAVENPPHLDLVDKLVDLVRVADAAAP